jgi:tRNA threonylcarbamoyladenosine biosynthesis protein TsaB
MIALGIETSSVRCSVGIANEKAPLGEESLSGASVHSEELLRLAQRLLEHHEIPIGKVDCIAVSSGPGSFTGLRIGFSAAKGLCFATGKPLVIVPTFFGLCRSFVRSRHHTGNILVALDAKKGDFYAGLFRSSNLTVERISDEALADAGGLNRRVEPGLVVLTDALALMRDRGMERVELIDAAPHFRGDVIAGLGIMQAQSGRFADLAQAEPLYLKDFVVKTKGAAS